MTKKAYNFTCTCEACSNDWPLLAKLSPDNVRIILISKYVYFIVLSSLKKNLLNDTILLKFCMQEKMLSNISKFDKMTPKILEQIKDLIALTEQKRSRYDEQTVKQLGNVLRIATANYAEPSYAICSLIDVLVRAYDKIYLTRVHITSRCKNW